MSENTSTSQDIEFIPMSECHESANSLLFSPSKEPKTRSNEQLLRHESERKPGILRRVGGERFEGWKFTIFLSFIASLIVLFFNVGFMIYAVAHPKGENNHVLYEGDYDKVHNLGIGFHLIINILGTCLLSASNFGMQCLVSPTRQDIDKAHKNGRWLDIGVPSVRNLFQVSKRRSFLWLCLSFSSLPFQLVHNSAVYYTTAVPFYPIFAGPGSLAEKDWLEINFDAYEGIYNGSSEKHEIDKSYEPGRQFYGLFDAAKKGLTIHNLSNADCISAFAQTRQTKYHRLLLVTDDIGDHDTYAFLRWNRVLNPGDILNNWGPGPYEWICWARDSDPCLQGKIATIQEWAINDGWIVSSMKNDRDNRPPVYKVDYCLAEAAPQHSRLQYSPFIIIVAIVFNLVKMGCLIHMWLGIKEAPLLTVGDAVASFIRHPDPHSQGQCLLTCPDAKSTDFSRLSPTQLTCSPREFAGQKRFWATAISWRRWVFSIVVWIMALITGLVLLSLGLKALTSARIDFWKQPLGTIVSQTLILTPGWPNDFLSNVLIANAPQLIYSLLYFASNSLLTSMCLGAETSAFAIRRKGLRVSSDPAGSQRTNYSLSVPYRYGIPMMVTSAVLHWLISLSLFTVAIEAYGPMGEREPYFDMYGCGYSPVAIISVLSIGTAMLLSLIVLSFRRFESGMPVARSSSMAIAASCHPHYDPNHEGKLLVYSHETGAEYVEDMALLPVQWGAIPVDGEIGHCSFTSGDVEFPEVGKLYQ